MNKNSLKNIYNSYAPNYSELIAKAGWWAPRVTSTYLKPYLKPNDKVLDAACGDGYSSLEILDTHKVYGFDLCDKMVEEAKKKSFQEVIIHDADKPFPYKDNFFDASLALGFFEFLKSPVVTLKEFKRVLKPGGYLLFTVEDLDEKLEKQNTKIEDVTKGVYKTRYSREEVLRYTNKLNFELISDDRIYGYYSSSLGGKYYYHYYLVRLFENK